MSCGRPVTLLEAVLALYRQDAAGGMLSDAPVLIGCCHEGVEITQPMESMDRTPTGSEFRQMLRSPSRHEINLESTWMIRTTDVGFAPHHRDAYVLAITWNAPGSTQWHQQIFWGVQTESRALRSLGVLQVMRNLRFTAEHVTESSGLSGSTTSPVGAEQSLVSILEDPWVVGARLRGEYQWSCPARIKSARLHANGSATVRLHVAGEASAISVESAGVWSGNIFLPANTRIHWMVEDVEGVGVVGAVTLNVLTEAPSGVLVADLLEQLIAWTESEAFSQLVRSHGEDGVLDSSTVQWPDGVPGVLTVTDTDSEFLAVDAFQITYVRGGGLPSYRVTQAEVTRNPMGDVISKPRPTVEVLA